MAQGDFRMRRIFSLAVLLAISFTTFAEESAALVRKLDADDFSARESASAELLKRGASVEQPLRAALEATPSPELKLRVESLLKALEGEIALASVAPGVASAGLQLTVAPAAREFSTDKTARLFARLKNVSTHPIRCVPIQEFNLHSPTREESSNTAQGVLAIRSASGDVRESKTTSVSFDLRRGQPDAVTLSPNQSIIVTVTLDSDKMPVPGGYEASVTYAVKSLSLRENATEDVTSNTIKLVVK